MMSVNCIHACSWDGNDSLKDDGNKDFTCGPGASEGSKIVGFSEDGTTTVISHNFKKRSVMNFVN